MRLSMRWKKFKVWLQGHQNIIGLSLIILASLTLLGYSSWLVWGVLQKRAALRSMAPLLTNGDFEGSTSCDTIYWTLTGGPFYTHFSEIKGPEGWTAWWREGFLCSGTDDWRTGRPEVKVISVIPDPERVHSGGRAVQWFTFWRCSEGGLLQQVAVEEGRYYQFSIYAHSWYSRCSLRPHDPPYDTGCRTRIYWAQDWLSVGIDPTGGLDPMASTVEWGARKQIYGRYGRPLETRRIQAQGGTLTVFVRREASHPLKHVDSYFDDAVLRDVTYQVFLPVVGR